MKPVATWCSGLLPCASSGTSPGAVPAPPAVQPAPPAVQPAPPAVQPEPPAVQPEPPAVQPEPPAVQPEPPARATLVPRNRDAARLRRDRDRGTRARLVAAFVADGQDAEAAAALADVALRELAGEHVPRAASVDNLLSQRDARIRLLAAGGTPASALALRFRISRSQVHRVIAAGRVAPVTVASCDGLPPGCTA